MTLNAKVGSFSTGTPVATNTIAVTGVGFQPEYIMFWLTGRSNSTDAIGRASHFRGFGVACSTTDRRSIASVSLDAVAAADAASAHDAAACILSVSPTTPAIDGQLDLQSFDADGFTLICDSATWPRDTCVAYLALGGDLTNAASGVLTEPVSTGDQDVTSLGFQPDFVMFFSAGIAADAPGAKIDSDIMIGAATAAAAQGVWVGGSNDAAANMGTASYCTAGECIAMLAANMGTINARADFVQFLSNGFRINWAERASTRRIHWVALKGGSYRVDNLLTQTDTTTDIVETSFGFQPTAAMFLSHTLAENASDTRNTDDILSIGAFDSVSSRLAMGVLDENGAADSEVTTAHEFDEVYVNITNTSTIAGLMDIKSVDADGFTMIMDDADPAQRFVWYVAFGSTAAAGGWGQLLSGKRNRLVIDASGITICSGSHHANVIQANHTIKIHCKRYTCCQLSSRIIGICGHNGRSSQDSGSAGRGHGREFSIERFF